MLFMVVERYVAGLVKSDQAAARVGVAWERGAED
jgi:hypothetical protein